MRANELIETGRLKRISDGWRASKKKQEWFARIEVIVEW